MTDSDLADWLLATLRMFGVSEVNSHRILAMFFEALEREEK